MIRQIGTLDDLQFIRRSEQQIYRHFLHCAKTEEPERVIRRFRDLFVRGTGYEENEIRLAVENVVDSVNAEAEFAFFLNRCCHIIINRWQMHPQFKTEIPELVAELETVLPPGGASSRSSRKLRQLVGNFQTTEHYLKLQRLVRLNDPTGEYKNRKVDSVENSVGDLIQRYPYLHKHCLLSEDSNIELEQTVKTIQTELQNNYELSLAQYITARVRLKQIVREYRAKNQTKIPKKLIKPVKNPTLLSDRELDYSLRHYMGKVEKNFTYRDLSLNFIRYSSELRDYKTFKQELQEYLVSGIDGNYGRQLKTRISQCLQRTLPDFDARQPDEFLKLRTYSQLFKFLVVDGKNNPDHNLYLDLIANLGETQTIGLLLKLVLLYHKVKPYLENRFSLLFSYYEDEADETAIWLVKSLENLQVAFSVHFGNTDFSLIKII